MVFGTLFLLIFGSAFFDTTAALPLTTASSLWNTTAVSSNSSSESQSVDGLQIHSVLSDSLQIGPPYAQVDQSNSTSNDSISPQQPSNDTRNKTDDDREDKKQIPEISLSRWFKIAMEVVSMKDRFANISRSFCQCPNNSRTFSDCKYSNYNRLKRMAFYVEKLVYRILVCFDDQNMSMFLNVLNSLLSQTYEVAPRWGWRNDRKLLQAKQELASHLLEDSKRGVLDPMTFQHCKNPADVEAFAKKDLTEIFYADLYTDDD